MFAQISSHVNVVRYYNSWIEPYNDSNQDDSEHTVDSTFSTMSTTLDDSESDCAKYTIHIQMQLCPSLDLRRWMDSRNGIIDSAENLEIIWQILSGLEHIHSHNIMHRYFYL